MTTIAAESGHWYDAKTAEPRYTVPNKSKPGEFRATTIRDAKANGYVPSVTTITRACLPAPGLEMWKMDQTIMSALTLPVIEGETLEDRKERIKTDAKEQATKAAEFGTNVHTAIERFMAGQTVEPEFEPFCIAALAELEKEIPGFTLEKCEAERSFVHSSLPYGGKVDLHSRDLNFVLDFKTKSFGPTDKVQPYDEQFIQLAAYKEGLSMLLSARVLNVFISTTTPGLVRIVEHDPAKHEKWWSAFKSMFETWQILKWR